MVDNKTERKCNTYYKFKKLALENQRKVIDLIARLEEEQCIHQPSFGSPPKVHYNES